MDQQSAPSPGRSVTCQRHPADSADPEGWFQRARWGDRRTQHNECCSAQRHTNTGQRSDPAALVNVESARAANTTTQLITTIIRNIKKSISC